MASFAKSAGSFREVVDTHVERLVSDLSGKVEAEIATATIQARREEREQARNDVAEELNQLVRRMRQTSTEEEVFTALLDSMGSFCERAALFTLTDRVARVHASRGMPVQDLEVPLAEAAAFVTALGTKDPVVAMMSAGEISPSLAETLSDIPGEKAYLFPLVMGSAVKALLFAAQSVQAAALELLCETAALQLQAIDATRSRAAETKSSGLVSIENAPPPVRAWDELSLDDQRLHLKAQRFARVKVAEYRLFQPDAVREGREKGDLYSQLRASIDADRDRFRQEFAAATPTMVDYFHLEMVRTLAHDDERLLGPHYPGPVV